MLKQLLIQITGFILISCSNVKDHQSFTETGVNVSSDVALESKFEQLTRRAILDSIVSFRLDSLTNFSWDTLVIIRPYFPIDTLKSMVQVNFKSIIYDNTALINDGVNILMFIKNKKMVNFVRLPRYKGDFYSKEGHAILAKDQCIFEFIRTGNKYENGQIVVIAENIP